VYIACQNRAIPHGDIQGFLQFDPQAAPQPIEVEPLVQSSNFRGWPVFITGNFAFGKLGPNRTNLKKKKNKKKKKSSFCVVDSEIVGRANLFISLS